MRDIETIDSELRLVAALRWASPVHRRPEDEDPRGSRVNLPNLLVDVAELPNQSRHRSQRSALINAGGQLAPQHHQQLPLTPVDRAGQPGFGAATPRPLGGRLTVASLRVIVCPRFNSSSIGSNRRIPLSFKVFGSVFGSGKSWWGMKRDVRRGGLIAHEKIQERQGWSVTAPALGR
jgi:hypothetical protein